MMMVPVVVVVPSLDQHTGAQLAQRPHQESWPRTVAMAHGSCFSTTASGSLFASLPADAAILEINATSVCSPVTMILTKFSRVLEFADCEQFCEEMHDHFAKLDSLDREASSQVIDWLLPVVSKLARSTVQGSRVVQKVCRLLPNSTRKHFLAALKPSFKELCRDKHGHHVLNALIESTPCALLDSMIQELCDMKPEVIALDRYGSRVCERMIEHCLWDQILELVDPILADVKRMSKHHYGNFVVKSLLEHGLPRWQNAIVEQILPVAAQIATHHSGSRVFQKMLSCCSPSDQARIVQELLKSASPDRLAKNVYGRILIEELEISQWSDVVVAWREDSLHSNKPMDPAPACLRAKR
jgi:hypothetical protein